MSSSDPPNSLPPRDSHPAPGPGSPSGNGARSRTRHTEAIFKPRILIIDDVLTIHEDFRKILIAPPMESQEMAQLEAAVLGSCTRPRQRTGFSIDSAFEGQEGLARVEQALIQACPYAVAFVDVRMPTGWDGIETAARLRQADPDLQIVICSAYSDYTWEQIIAKVGHSDGLLMLKKPFDSREVLQLAEALNQKWALARDARTHVADLDQILTQRTQVLNERTRELGAVSQTLAQETAQRSLTQARLWAFATLAGRLNGARTTQEACQLIAETARQLLRWDACQIHLYAPATKMLTHLFSADLTDGRSKETASDAVPRAPSSFERKAIQEGGQLAQEVESQTDRPVSILCVPIRDGDGVTGVLSIQSYNSSAYDQSSIETLQALGDHCGGVLDRIAMHTRITRVTELEANLEKLHKQLAEASRQTGLAEVATGVLHNVGNVLNSVNVSVNVLAESLKDSKAPNLKGIVALLKAHSGDLGQFITTDPKGRHLPRYLEHLTEHLINKHATLSGELESLTRNVEHIKNIVAVQQSYARVSGVLETVSAQELVEDALNLHTGALRRHGVQVIREFDAHAPRVTVDRHRVLQVLVNLIGNAKYACDESRRTDKKMTLRVSNGGERVCISVEDNGVGIPPECLPRIFTLGFTTRKNGHGFGLHNCALAAREMGGSLAVHSDGPDQGAIFKLELPICPQQN